MIDFGVAINIMLVGVMKQLGMWVDTNGGKCYAMEIKPIPIVGVMKDVEVKLATYAQATYNIDVTVIDTPPQVGMLLSRKWTIAVGGNVQFNLSFATILVNGQEVKLYREPRMNQIVDYMPQDQLNCFCDVDFGSFRIEPAQPKLVNIDPINKHVSKKHGGVWKMYFDGACNQEGNGAGIVFISPEGTTFKYSFLLAFECTKNIVEYEALITGLNMAVKHKIKLLVILGDSELVVSQVK